MGLRQFNADVKAAASSPCERVSEIRRGDSDGEIVFTYTAPNLAPIEIQALATDVDSYPKSSGFLIFTSSENVGKDLVDLLEGLATDAAGKLVPQVIDFISTRLTAKLESTTTETTDGGGSIDDGDDVEFAETDSSLDATDYSDYDEEFQMDLDPLPPSSTTRKSNPVVGDLDAAKLFKRDMRQASSVGFFVSLLAMDMTDQARGIFSLAVRVSKLGIPDEALEAWDLKNSDHIIMLVRIPMGYLSASVFLMLPSDQSSLEFRFGKCAGPRPSLSTARSAFDPKGIDSERVDKEESTLSSAGVTNGTFMPLCMSDSLDSLLNREFLGLLLLRQQEHFTWNQALALKFNLSRGNHRRGHPEVSDVLEAVDQDEKPTEKEPDAPFLQHDYVTDRPEDLNIPLVAMQFGLRRLVKCTKYCMVCHQIMNQAFEALKPYVCDNSLCLYQYLALGFGQSIEHEIIHNPYVVDLLISFFYAAVMGNRLREFPTGLNLRCVNTGSLRDPAKNIKVDVCFKEKTIRFGSGDYISYSTVKEGNFVLLVIISVDPMPSMSIMTGGLERHICVITSVTGERCTFRIVKTITEPLNVISPLPAGTMTQSTHPSAEWMKVLLFQYHQDIDDMDASERNNCLMFMTHAIPSVLEMRGYLMEQPGRLLKSWKRMDPSTLALLNWIVASNRSFIVQDDAVPNQKIPDEDALSFNPNADPVTVAPITHPNRVQGMDGTWMQFRFAQGSPEKEQKFIRELETQGQDNGAETPFPSLFAWHGSPLGSWHGIIRTGLDFSTSLHGRTFGNGVYFSSDFAVSNGYSGFTGPNPTRLNGWPNSLLHISSAISICEIINKPEKFVSSTPHYVVDKVEWIQCRYLFVRVRPDDMAIAQPLPKPLVNDSSGYLTQDPARSLIGPKRCEINIPLSAIPARRRQSLFNNKASDDMPSVPQLTEASREADVEDEMKDDVHNLWDSDDKDGDTLMVRNRRRSSEDSGMEVSRPFKLTTAMQESKNARGSTSTDDTTLTDFMPGTLGLESLPNVPEPTWASSSPEALHRINKEIMELQRIQSRKNISDNGWYIDFDKMDNLFLWYVELHSFNAELPLAQDMMRAGCSSIVLEFRVGASFPFSPPFVRVVRPRFLPFAQGGGGHVTAGGAICSELLTNSGWTAALTLEKVFLEIRMNLCDMNPPAHLDPSPHFGASDYGIGEAMEAFRRAVAGHGWQLPADFGTMAASAR
ncbi:hypothetical protein B0J13DRAFT_641358 [Dactylonectria estremocensis]|uniref:UBC core domain-containing protein n=1 Tax=Dactylonectria estremocensis TaxID=1079267 RepID=A0A9P9EDV0_9HYPO|nr:hypothetical protein B0J13DRAFT_641358 [Dactylonectria estremocensis]